MAKVIAILKSLIPVTSVAVTKERGSYCVTIERTWLGRTTSTTMKASEMV